jgi:hypothetical protein
LASYDRLGYMQLRAMLNAYVANDSPALSAFYCAAFPTDYEDIILLSTVPTILFYYDGVACKVTVICSIVMTACMHKLSSLRLMTAQQDWKYVGRNTSQWRTTIWPGYYPVI